MGQRSVVIIMVTVLVATTGYGVSFPLLAISLENMKVSSALIGVNAAMPALGWIVASLLVPKLHTRFTTRSLMISFLLIAICGLVGFVIFKNYLFWLFCRFLFGGGLGMFFRTVEYHLTATVDKEKRGKTLGIYITFFLAGIIIGSSLQPLFGTETIKPYGFILACLVVSVIFLLGLKAGRSTDLQSSTTPSSLKHTIRKLHLIVPVAAAGAVVYGLIESIPAYLMPVYALKSGLDEVSAAYTVTAFAAGNVLFAIPLGGLSDKIGRAPILYGCVTTAVLCLLAVPYSLSLMPYFYTVLFVIGGCIVGLYSSCLAIIGDHFTESELIGVNASFGILYAIGSLIGPVMHGVAMQVYEPNGMIISAILTFALFLLFGLKTISGKAKLSQPF